MIKIKRWWNGWMDWWRELGGWKTGVGILVAGLVLGVLGAGAYGVLVNKQGGQSVELVEKEKDWIVEEEAESGMVEEERRVRVLFGGDVMLDRHIREAAEKRGYDFVLKEAGKYWTDMDLVVINLEGPVTDNLSVSKGSVIGSSSNYIFTFDPGSLESLVKFNVGLVNLGNNHILNFGENGLVETVGYLRENGIEYFGDTGVSEYNRTAIVEVDGLRLGMVSYNQFVNGSDEWVKSEVDRIKGSVDWLVVYAHWGEEYVLTAGEVIREKAYGFIDLGADTVIGSHPHVVQDKEVYKGKMIYYSMGNLVFDQYFSTETKKGLMVEMVIDAGALTAVYVEHEVEMKENGQTIWREEE